jgi:predicted ATP-dependent endonuclease of OLD family
LIGENGVGKTSILDAMAVALGVWLTTSDARKNARRRGKMMEKEQTAMTSIVLHTTSGPDGKLHLEVPVGQPDTEFEVEVKARPKGARVILPTGYFDLIGSIDDETFVRQPQGEVPPRVELE